MTVIPASDAAVARAADLLRSGRLVAFPTETVYGLGGDATNGAAVAAIYAAKGRPSFNPLIVHVADIADLDGLVVWTDLGRLLATSLWPGPLTLVLPRAPDSPVSLLASAGLDTMAARVPSHPVARQLLRAVGRPIAAPSANASGQLSPTAPAHVATSLGDRVNMILAGGRCPIGLESTVVDATSDRAAILRPGGVTAERLQMILGYAPAPAIASPDAPASPGMLASHYAPSLPLRLNADAPRPGEAFLAFGPVLKINGETSRNLSPSGDLNEAAANLFAMLRDLDRPTFTGIAVAPVPATGLGIAINDRLTRAAVR